VIVRTTSARVKSWLSVACTSWLFWLRIT
jgi:hypothetical protein